MKLFSGFIPALFAIIFILSCESNSDQENDTTYEQGDDIEAGDQDEIESQDTTHKDDTDVFITAGSQVYEDTGNTGDTADTANTADTGDTVDDQVVREIIESDIYKIQESILWVVNKYKGLVAIDITDHKNLKIIGRAAFKGVPGEMYLQDDKAYILVTGLDGSDLGKNNEKEGFWTDRLMSKLIVVDIQNPFNPVIKGSYEMDGTIIDSRQVGDVIYLASTQDVYYWSECDLKEEYGVARTTLMSINVADPVNIKKVDEVSLEGTAYTIYVSQRSIYIAAADYDNWKEGYSGKYPVTLFDISDPSGKIIKKCQFETKGFMSDRWKMHEKDNVFFAVSTSSPEGAGISMIESFDISDPENVQPVGSLVFMEDQRLYGTRFDGGRMYAVTYFRQDPLHVIDINDPAEMKELGQLQVPGWSNHLEVRGDKIITIGIDNTQGNQAKVSMYDVSDPAEPEEMSTVVVGNSYSYSEATQDWKAFKIFDDLGLILLPVNEYENENEGEDEEDTAWRYVYRLYLIDFDLEKGLVKRGSVKAGSPVLRGIVVDSTTIMSVSDRHVMMIDASNRDEPIATSNVTLAYYAGNLNKCGDQLCSLENNDQSQPPRLVTYDPESAGDLVKWESEGLFQNRSSGYMFPGGPEDMKYVLSDRSFYETEGENIKFYKKIAAFEFKTGEPPLMLQKIDVFGFEKSKNYSYHDKILSKNKIMTLVEARGGYYFPDNDCYSYDEGCVTSGKRYSVSGSNFHIYDLNNPLEGSLEPVSVLPVIRTLDYNTRPVVNENILWYTECETVSFDEQDREQVVCYAVPADLKDPAKPVIGTRINIPGKIVGISSNGKYLYTLHHSWSNDNISGNEYIKTLFILKFDEDRTKVDIVKKINIPMYYQNDENGTRYHKTDYFIDNESIFISTEIDNYNSLAEQCINWDNRKEKSVQITVYAASDGEKIFEKKYLNSGQVSHVDGGGLLVSIDNDLLQYYGFSEAEEIYYIYPSGKEKFLNTEKTVYRNDSYHLSGALIDNVLYISRDWNGIESHSLK